MVYRTELKSPVTGRVTVLPTMLLLRGLSAGRLARVAAPRHYPLLIRGLASTTGNSAPAVDTAAAVPATPPTVPVAPNDSTALTALSKAATSPSTAAPSADVVVHGPLLPGQLSLEQMGQPGQTADIAFRTVPVPVLVGPAPEAAPALSLIHI